MPAPRDDLHPLGREIRNYRRRRGLTQESLAAETEISQNSISMIEIEGPGAMSISRFTRLLRALRVPKRRWPDLMDLAA